VKARFKTGEWIKAYGVNKSFNPSETDVVQYIIPSYKIERLVEIEEENVLLRRKLKLLKESLQSGAGRPALIKDIESFLEA
jgi:hypothetical protein